MSQSTQSQRAAQPASRAGFDLSLAEEVCKRNDWKLIKRPISWDSKDSELTSGAISCIWNGFTMNGREKSYTWSTPYLNNYQVVIVRKDSSIKKPADLKGKVLVVQSGKGLGQMKQH